jgi:NADH-quinone oxidoreductase subunit M
MLKLGTYGIVRFCLPLFPQSSVAWAPIIATLGVIGIIYGAWVSYAQKDVKKLVAYSSVSHLGFVIVGIFALNAAGIEGATLQMVNHGISTGGLFLIVGMLYERRHTKAIDAYGGIWKVMPLFGALSLIITLSSMGLPGLNSFVGEFTILLGAVGSSVLGFGFALFATLGVILAAVYMLYMFQKVYMGDVTHEENRHLPALHWNEIAVLVPILIAIFLVGIAPYLFFRPMDASAAALEQHVQNQAPAVAISQPQNAPVTLSLDSPAE